MALHPDIVRHFCLQSSSVWAELCPTPFITCTLFVVVHWFVPPFMQGAENWMNLKSN